MNRGANFSKYEWMNSFIRWIIFIHSSIPNMYECKLTTKCKVGANILTVFWQINELFELEKCVILLDILITILQLIVTNLKKREL